jgi:DNA-binding NarL/FixJ family response regulator
MAAERLSMRKIKELLRLDAEGLSEREISRSLKLSRSTVQRYRQRAEEAGLTWPLPTGPFLPT